MAALIPCKHLDYTTEYGPDIELTRLGPPYEHVRFWKRGETWTSNGPGHPDRNPQNVQFCGKGRGRINSILDCYDGSRGACYEPETSAPNVRANRPAEHKEQT